jgi:hypothetical protein
MNTLCTLGIKVIGKKIEKAFQAELEKEGGGRNEILDGTKKIAD